MTIITLINEPGLKVTARLHEWNDRLDRKTRVYVSGEGSPKMETPPYTIKGEDLDVDRAWRRYNKLEKQLQAVAIAPVMRRLWPDKQALTFSRHAGCSCACSPGWIAPARLHGGPDSQRLSDVWVKVS